MSAMRLLTEDAILKCDHGGTVKLEPIQHWVMIAKRAILVEGDSVGRSISGCITPPLVTTRCGKTVSVDRAKSYSSFVRINGLPVCKDTTTGATDWNLMATSPYTVTKPGQDLVTVGG